MEDSTEIGRQFTIDFEFVASCLGHALVIIAMIFFLPRIETVWRWIGRPVVKKDKNKRKKVTTITK